MSHNKMILLLRRPGSNAVATARLYHNSSQCRALSSSSTAIHQVRRSALLRATSLASNSNFPLTNDVRCTETIECTPLSSFQKWRNYSTTMPSAKEYPSHTLFPMPALSPTMDMGTIAKWNLKEGESFSAGDTLCEIETDKATVDFEAQDDGILAKILKDGDNARDLSVGVPICVVVEEEEDVSAFADFVLESGDSTSTTTTSDEDGAAAPSSSAEVATAVPVRDVGPEHALSPAARHISQSKGVDATVLAGSGKGGRVTKGDVLLALKQGTFMPPLAKASPTEPAPAAVESTVASAASTPAPTPVITADVELPTITSSGSYTDTPNNNMRKVIAKRLTESKSTVPHFYSTVQVELDSVLALRKNLASNHDTKVSVNDLIIRSSALALRDIPEVNASYDPKTKTVSTSPTVDISVAVATPTGLITPIVPNTDKLGLADITSKVKDLATRARDGKLQPEEYQGGTFCISNLGMFGINEFSAVINPPQAAILAVGGGVRTVVPTKYVEGAEVQEKPAIKTIMTARLSADRRVVDEATAALFLSAFRYYLSKPELLLL